MQALHLHIISTEEVISTVLHASLMPFLRKKPAIEIHCWKKGLAVKETKGKLNKLHNI